MPNGLCPLLWPLSKKQGNEEIKTLIFPVWYQRSSTPWTAAQMGTFAESQFYSLCDVLLILVLLSSQRGHQATESEKEIFCLFFPLRKFCPYSTRFFYIRTLFIRTLRLRFLKKNMPSLKKREKLRTIQLWQQKIRNIVCFPLWLNKKTPSFGIFYVFFHLYKIFLIVILVYV